MTRTSVFTRHFEAPVAVHEPLFTLEPLAPQHNDLDYDAWQSSVEELQGIFGPGHEWPKAEYSKARNLEDLQRHYREFEQGEAYAYTILSPDQSLCIGCVYIQPPLVHPYDTHVDFWFRSSHKHLEAPFMAWLKQWLATDWGLKTPAFPGRELSWQDYHQRRDKTTDHPGA
ncbi:hypothetical protein [Marinimicrobium sp. LS-A18]|uniref:hypothetical protein n=1 Tax=Marinimicrobium sp. LS-A18 TaxID=1381596 RepID=UPI0004630A3E|nr:hypothetical protein [Marinimicrobium sp. LS-A18]